MRRSRSRLLALSRSFSFSRMWSGDQRVSTCKCKVRARIDYHGRTRLGWRVWVLKCDHSPLVTSWGGRVSQPKAEGGVMWVSETRRFRKNKDIKTYTHTRAHTHAPVHPHKHTRSQSNSPCLCALTHLQKTRVYIYTHIRIVVIDDERTAATSLCHHCHVKKRALVTLALSGVFKCNFICW